MKRWFYFSLLIIAIILVAILCTLCTLEDTFLLHPTACDVYRQYDPNEIQTIPLQSGGLLLRLQTTVCSNRILLALHGNAGNIDGMSSYAEAWIKQGYQVYLLEYVGYGTCSSLKPSTSALVANLCEAWTHLPKEQRSSAILLGFSMGGGVIGQFLQRVTPEQMPGQVVLVNTYFDLPMLVRDVFPIPGVSTFMRTRWNIQKGIERYAMETLPHCTPNVLVVATLDDELIPLKHAQMIIESVPDKRSVKELVALPSGGHNHGPSSHMGVWLPKLLSAQIKVV